MYGFWGTAATLASVPRSAAGAAKEVLSEGFSYITGLPFLNPKDLTSAASNLLSKGKTLFHYTSEKGLKGILESGKFLPSVGAKNARYGVGQYLTDIAPGQMTRGETAQRL